ncbi:phosphate/phosphite/phosphonate ABC transporter substrate-binding protein [Sulfurivermis fontis]|uniref:phosphate/phosphite/phosphonate ABC transporter substrate-binding protein n=1 Tax=Sulfurivermis fontis TaxID=1972068 RepID=UPI000FD6F6B0|nr:PhnD/SsuA/transferrin family substrate-binding protein [Sulfurivermis fontis]
MLHQWMRKGLGIVLGCCLASAVLAKDEIVFSTAPTQTPEQTIKLYTPLINYLSQVTGKQFVIKPARNYLEYNNGTLQNAYDMVFDGPHYTAWRMERQGAIPIARLPGAISIVVAVREDSNIRQLDDLIGRNVCAFSSPNMLTMDFLNYFRNPARQPVLLRVEGFKEINECLKSGRGDAAVLRDQVWAKQDQTGLRLIAHAYRKHPERTFSVAADIEPELREKIAAALISEEGNKVAAPLLEVFKKEKFIPAYPADYEGLGELLAPVWGFQ